MFSMSFVSVTVCRVHLALTPLRYNKLFIFSSSPRQPEGRSDNTAAQLLADSTYFLSIKAYGLKTSHPQNIALKMFYCSSFPLVTSKPHVPHFMCFSAIKQMTHTHTEKVQHYREKQILPFLCWAAALSGS